MRTLFSLLTVPVFLNMAAAAPDARPTATRHLMMVPAPFVVPAAMSHARAPLKMPAIGETRGFGLRTVSVWISGPQTRTTGEEGTWTAMPSGGVTPYSYAWGGDVSGSTVSVSATFYDEAPHPISVTVTDANSQQGYLEFTLWVCMDVC